MENITEDTKEVPANTKQPKKNHSFLIMNIIYIVLILAMAGGGVYGYLYLTESYEQQYTEAYNKAVSEQKAVYDSARKQYDEAYDKLLKEESDWKVQLEEKQNELNASNAELQAIYDARQAENTAEATRIASLSKEELEAELTCYKYNEMVSELRATDPEYAKIYVEYSKYLLRNLFALSREEAKAYTELYDRKNAIEEAYLSSHAD